MTENKNLNMCYDKWFKMKGRNKILSLEQNGLVDWAKWKWKKPEYGIFFTYVKKDLQRIVTAIYDVDLV